MLDMVPFAALRVTAKPYSRVSRGREWT
jgi:hypothetical protein